MYKLYKNPAECDSDNWGRPHGKFRALSDAMTAAGHPEPAAWYVMSRHCPGEVSTLDDISPSWSILAPGAAQEAVALGTPDVDVIRR